MGGAYLDRQRGERLWNESSLPMSSRQKAFFSGLLWKVRNTIWHSDIVGGDMHIGGVSSAQFWQFKMFSKWFLEQYISICLWMIICIQFL